MTMPRFCVSRFSVLLLALLGFISACRPFGRSESSELMPSDSLSRRIAAKVPIERLERLWISENTPEHDMIHPQTVRFGPNNQIYVGDVERNRIFVYDLMGKRVGEIASSEFKYPYLAGFKGDTVLVLNRGLSRLEYYKQGRKVHTMSIPQGPMTYVGYHKGQYYYKVTGADDSFQGLVARLKPNGQIGWPSAKFSKKRFWRYAGNLRMWGDRPMSLSGFRPVVDFLRPNGGLDTLKLTGFDSPMLRRSRAFIVGDEWNPPLLTPAAVALDTSLFVLNLRAGWLRIDRYDEKGMLQQVAETPKPQYQKNWTPMDMDAKHLPDGRLIFAIVYHEPTPSVRLYQWQIDAKITK